MKGASSLGSDYGRIEEKLFSIRTLSALSLSAMFIFVQPHVLHAQQSPQAIAEGEITDLETECRQGGHDFVILYNPIIELDLGGTSDREVILDQHALECEGDSLLLYGTGRPHIDIISTDGQIGYMSWERPSIVWLDDQWAVRFEMDPSVETEECAGYCFRYVYVRKDKLVERYISER
jgi:hypothetical protein